MTVHYEDHSVTVHHGDALDVLRSLPAASVDAVVTDPPYGLEFMGKDWDRPWAVGMSKPGYGDAERMTRPNYGDNRNATCASCGGRMRGAKRCSCDVPQWKPTGAARGVGRQDVRQPGDDTFQEGSGPYGRAKVRHGVGGAYGGDGASAMRAFQAWCEEWAVECLRVLKPGGHMLAFGGTRTFHRLACAVEDAGFEIRDSIAWLYGSGFPPNPSTCPKPSTSAATTPPTRAACVDGSASESRSTRPRPCGRWQPGSGFTHAWSSIGPPATQTHSPPSRRSNNGTRYGARLGSVTRSTPKCFG